MGNDDLVSSERTTKFYAESATEWQLKLIVWEFFCTLTWESRARSCGRKRRAHVTRWLRYWARTVRPGVTDPLRHLAFVIRWPRECRRLRRKPNIRGALWSLRRVPGEFLGRTCSWRTL